MGSKRFLFTFGIAGGLIASLCIGGVMALTTGHPSGGQEWATLALTTILVFIAGGYLTWFQWAARRNAARAELISQVAQGDLTVARGGAVRPAGRHAAAGALAPARAGAGAAGHRRTCTAPARSSRTRRRRCSRRRGGRARRWIARSARSGGMGESLQAGGQARLPARDLRAADHRRALGDDRADRAGRARAHHARRVRARHLGRGPGDGRAAHADRRAPATRSSASRARRRTSSPRSRAGSTSVRRRANETGDLAREVTATSERGETLVVDR